MQEDFAAAGARPALEQQSRKSDLSVIRVEVRVQAKILNKPHEVSRVEHKQDRPKDRTLGNSTA